MALPAVLQSARGRASHRLIRCFTQTAWPHIRTETSEQQPPMSGVVGVSGRDAVRDSTQGPPASTSGRPWLPGLQPTTAGLRCFHASLRQGAEEQGSGGQQGLPPLPTHDVLYYGPLSKTHSLLKRISIANTLISFAAAPAILYWSDISYVSRVGLAMTLVFFGVLTTGALHWITKPYVHELTYRAADKSIEVKTTSLFGRLKTSTFQLSDVKPLPWDRPVATFMAKDRYYYIDIYSFPDENLLKYLHPQEVPEGYKPDEDED